MNYCRNPRCRRRATLFLCDDCTTQLANMIDELPWLLAQLDITATRRDRLTTGNTIGQSTETPSPVNFDAADLARQTHTTLAKLITTLTRDHEPFWPKCAVTHDFIGPLPPAWRRLTPAYKPTTTEYIDWLMRRPNWIARHTRAGHTYTTLATLVGENEEGGTLVHAINRQDRTYYGPCTNTTGRHRDGTPRQCGQDLYAPRESTTVTCPRCDTTMDPQKQLMATIADRDLVTEPKLLEALDNLGEHVPRPKLYAWIKAGRLQPRGWVHQGRIVSHRVRRGDPRVFSLSQARQLRWKDTKERTR